MAWNGEAQDMFSPVIVDFQSLFQALGTQQPIYHCGALVRDYCYPMLQIRTLGHGGDELLKHKTNQGCGGSTGS